MTHVPGVTVTVVALMFTPACMRSVPINFTSDGAAIVGEDAKTFMVAGAERSDLIIGPDWDLAVTLRDGQRRTILEPHRVGRSEGDVRVVDRWGESRFPAGEVAALRLEQPDTAGTVAAVAGVSVLVGLGIWGLVGFASAITDP